MLSGIAKAAGMGYTESNPTGKEEAMKHHIIVKFREGVDVDALLEPVERIFAP